VIERALLFLVVYGVVYIVATMVAGYQGQQRLSRGLRARAGRRPTWNETVQINQRADEDPTLPWTYTVGTPLSDLLWPLWMGDWYAATERAADELLRELAPAPPKEEAIVFVGDPPKRGPTLFVRHKDDQYRPATPAEIESAANRIKHQRQRSRQHPSPAQWTRKKEGPKDDA
jgi:hypothetical protein